MALARSLGLDVRDPVPLRSTNNLVLWLAPAPVVAKVGTGKQARLRLELAVASGLRELHAALARLPAGLRAGLPTYTHDLPWIRSLLADVRALPALREVDRKLLAHTFDRLLPRLEEHAPPAMHRVIHGSPHSYNILQVDGLPRFIDFETTCTGPMEWDLAHVDSTNDSPLRWLCASMASLKTAVLCWRDVERGDFREHAELHLENVRSNVAPKLLSGRFT